MFRYARYDETMRAAWDQLALTKGTIFHTSGFRQILLDTFGYRCDYHAVLDQGGRVVGILPLVTGRNLGLKVAGVSLPFVNHADICADSEEALLFAQASLHELKEKLGLDYLEIRLKDQNGTGPGWVERLDNHTFILPLAAAEEAVLALSTASNRNHVRKVYKNGLFSVSFDVGNLAAFYNVYVQRMKQLGSPAPDISFFKRFFEQLSEHAYLLSVLDNQSGKVVGGMLLLTSPGDRTLYYPYGASLVEYNNRYLNNFMYWEAVRLGIRSGMQYLDLGRSQTGSGTYRYKQQWGARAAQLRYLIYDGGSGASGPPDREKLGVFIKLWKVVPSLITDRVGRELIKYLMP